MSEDMLPIKMISDITLNRGLMWEKIAEFQNQLESLDESMSHKAGDVQSEEMMETFPLKQNIEGGLYTREIFMPKGSLVVSMIHKQQHPSFLLRGKVSYLTDEGTISTIEAPHKIFTQTGAQRVLYIHEDTEWCCVYRTDATTFQEAEADVYTNDYKDLPDYELISKLK
tara:strand:- start:204 stop:710 length:507 start_codon:yes stop_codon:yes gene_type:complete